jgi:hypothetical protein
LVGGSHLHSSHEFQARYGLINFRVCHPSQSRPYLVCTIVASHASFFRGRLGDRQSLARRFALGWSYQTELLAAFSDIDVVQSGRILPQNLSLGLQG